MDDVVSDTVCIEKLTKSKNFAKMDFIQSATGLFLGVFMWGHMLLVSSILISKDAMYHVSKFFELGFLIKGGTPITVFIVIAVVTVAFIVHAGIAVRKFPASFSQYKVYFLHSKMLRHPDTTAWFWQVFTGFSLFFLASIHLYIMITNPGNIGPYASADRVFSSWLWPMYLLLLFAVEIHGSLGLYRLSVKWGWFDGKNPTETRKKLKKVKWALTVFFLAIGILTLIAYIKIGIDHQGEVGQRYTPQASYQQGSSIDNTQIKKLG